MNAEILRVQAYEHAAMKGDVTPKQALGNALGVEQMMAEGDFYNTVESDADEFCIIARQLIDLSKIHMQSLRSELRKHLV